MENQNNAAQVVTDIGLPALRDLLKAAFLSGEQITLSHLSAGALYYAMSTPHHAPVADLALAQRIGMHLASTTAIDPVTAGKVAVEIVDMLPRAEQMPAVPSTPCDAMAQGAWPMSSDDLGKLKADAQEKAADGANWSMDVGCMFVLAMIERIEAGADKVLLAEIERLTKELHDTARSSLDVISSIGLILGADMPTELVTAVARQRMERIAELEALLAAAPAAGSAA